jgi:hypothetical protein
MENWMRLFKGYAESIVAKESWYKPYRGKFKINPPFSLYSNITRVKAKNIEYDLRFSGQSIATIVGEDEEIYISTKGKDEHNKEYFDVDLHLDYVRWNDTISKNFRSKFTSIKKRGKGKECAIENLLLKEFGKPGGEGKKLRNIQIVKLLDSFFQMPVPLRASSELKYSKGHIDILSRVTHRSGEHRLCIMELKDENKKKESPQIAMKQAVIYATFIAWLLRSNLGSEWYKIFQLREPQKNLTIDVSIIMPTGEDTENFKKIPKVLVCKNTWLKLYSLYFDPDTFQFTGSLKEDMLP